jgi:O-antigen/teichoic acid export membrane protein
MTNKFGINSIATRAGIWHSIANILLKGCIFLTLPIFTRILSTSDFGIFNTYMAYEGIITALLGLGLYGTVKNARFDFKDNFNEYLSSVLTMSLLCFLVTTIIINIFFNAFFRYLGFSRFVLNILILQSFGSFLIYFYGNKLNIEFKYKLFIIISSFNTIFNILLSYILIVFVFPHERYIGRILGSSIPLILISTIITFSILVQGKTFFNKKYWRYAVTIGIPLIPHVVSQSLLSQVDRIMISNIIGTSESGIYSFIYTICTIMSIISASLDNAWVPWVYHSLYQNNINHIRQASKKYIMIYSMISLMFMCCMPEITKIVANGEYWEGISLIIPLTLSNYLIFLYAFPVNIEYFYKKTKFISIGTVCAAILNFLLNYIALNILGYKTAAYTTLISYIALFSFHWCIAKKYHIDEIYDLKFIVKITTVLTVLSFTILIINRYTFLSLGFRYSIVLIIFSLVIKTIISHIEIIKLGDKNNESIKKVD